MGKFSDKFLSMLRIDDDDYDDDDIDNTYNDDDEEDYQKESRFQKKKAAKVQDTQRDRYTEPVTEPVKPQTSYRRQQSSKVVPINRNSHNPMEVCVIKPSTVEDSREIIDTLLSGRSVVLNFEGLMLDVKQRVIDFTAGACYSINGNFQMISTNIFIITPETVEISGDIPEILSSGGFDVSSFK